MSYTDRHIIDTYTDLFRGLSWANKIALIESLTNSLKKEASSEEDNFYQSYGAFGSEKSAEEIISEIKSNKDEFKYSA